MIVLMSARVSLAPGDLVRYCPKFADPYRDKLAYVEEILDESKHPLRVGPEATPYWLRVKFKNGTVKTLNAQAFVIEEVRQNIIRIL
ncbi:MAG: hypothetical protein KGI70_00840 [Patescibacteria group bacterium]|nr:hypothetical protein [Patescibacteria group bacterium]